MTSSLHSTNVDSMPRDVLDHTLDFLTGSDLLALGCVSKAMCADVDADDRVWRKRLLTDQDQTEPTSWKEQYVTAQSLRLTRDDRDRAIALPNDTAAQWQTQSFSIDLWFCMLPQPSSKPIGGVLLGAQSSFPTDQENKGPIHPEFHQQLIHVDPHGNLYCSVTKNKPIVKTKLALERWYHVALTFSNGLQCVYLNGALLHVVREPLHVEWGKMKNLQFGSGYMTYGSKGRPCDTFVGWYGFHGHLDAHRVWGHALSMGDVQRLARGQRVDGASAPPWSHKHSDHKGKHFVRCPRPLERHCAFSAFH